LKEEKTNSKYKKEDKRKSHKKNTGWPIIVLLLTLALSFVFSLISELVMGNAPLAVAYILIIAIIILSVIFDMIGTAAASCDIQPFLSMSARKVKGAKMAVKLVQNASKVSSVCADIIGDICGIISGACGAAIVIKQFADGSSILVSVLFSALIAAFTVFGKSLGKSYAMTNSNKIIYMVARVLSVFKKN
jgi:CBS domain containing-hemolysin-like protein